MEFIEDQKNTTSIECSLEEFELVRLSFFKRNTQQFFLLKEVLTYIRPYVKSVEIRKCGRNVDFKFFLPFTCDVHRLMFNVGWWRSNGNYSLGLYYEDKEEYHFTNLLATSRDVWDEESGYLRHTFSGSIKFSKLRKFLSIIVDKIHILNTMTAEPRYEI